MRNQGVLMTMLLVLGVATAGTGLAVAQQATPQEPPAAQAPENEEEARELLNEMQQIQQRLISVQEQALQNDPELQEQAQEYQQTLLAAMRAEGFDPMQSLNHIELIEKQIQSQTLNEQEREGLMAEVQEEEARLQQAEQAALQQEGVQQAREQLMEGMLAAMRKQEPQTDELIQDLEDKNAELRSIMTAEAPTQ